MAEIQAKQTNKQTGREQAKSEVKMLTKTGQAQEEISH